MNRRGFKRTIVTVQTDRFLHYGAFWTMSFPKFGKRAVTSLLSYASEECMDITPIFVSSGTIRSLNVPCGEGRFLIRLVRRNDPREPVDICHTV